MTNEEIKEGAVEVWNQNTDKASVEALSVVVDYVCTTYRAQVLEEVMEAVKTKQQEAYPTFTNVPDYICRKCRENITQGSICYMEGNCPKHPTN